MIANHLAMVSAQAWLSKMQLAAAGTTAGLDPAIVALGPIWAAAMVNLITASLAAYTTAGGV